MKHYRYTKKNELPVPKYKEGQRVWKTSCVERYGVEYTTIRKVLPPIWVDYGDMPHWVVRYRHKPMLNERMAQYPIEEERLFDTAEEALEAEFELFYKDTFKQLESFKKRFKALGAECPNVRLIE